MFADSHSHIHAQDFDVDREDIVKRANLANVKYIVDVCDDIKHIENLIKFCSNHKNIYTTVGVHPEYADKYTDLTVYNIMKYLKSLYVIGIGECGLDYYYNKDTKDAQIKVFKLHIEAAQNSGLPLIIHNRNADNDMMQILYDAYKIKPFKGELHCFSSSAELRDFALSIGFYISASGIITFKKSYELRNMFIDLPLDRLLIETDSPYLAPEPNRGKRNEPSFVVHTAEMLAKLKNISIEEIALRTTDNFFDLFTKVKRDER